jgi:hypothetical protein
MVDQQDSADQRLALARLKQEHADPAHEKEKARH